MVDRAVSGVEKLTGPQRDVCASWACGSGRSTFSPGDGQGRAIGIVAAASGKSGIIAHPMAPVLKPKDKATPLAYRRLGNEALRIDRADRLLREAHARRKAGGRRPLPSIRPRRSRSA
jgi:ATP-dependent RNA helicase SUPV3L1/SUV3